jgi:hypothetical protein
MFSKPLHLFLEKTIMIGIFFTRLTSFKRNLLVFLTSSAVLTAGCSYAPYTAPGGDPMNSPATLSGNVHGGNQPVTGATITLWFAGQGGSPSLPATKGATTTTDRQGFFSFTRDTSGGAHDGTTSTYACPTNVPSSLVYVLSQGGNTQNNGVSGQTNTAAAFIALYGNCTDLTANNFVYMSEVTTVATMVAVQQFFDPANDTLAASGTDQQRLIILNLPNTVKLLANAATGLAVSSTSVPAATGGDIPQSVSLTATPETAKINTLANIISSCVNGATSAAPACGALFAAAAPPNANVTSLNPTTPFTAATDTLQALFYIFTNPTNSNSTNLSSLFGLAPGVGAPFLPALTEQPTDWTIGVVYASTSNCNTPDGDFLEAPVDISIDAQDNVWFANSAGGNLSAISSSGAPLACVLLDASSTRGGANIDAANNVWFGAGTTVYRYNPTTRTSLAFPAGVSPFGLTADGAGNVYFSATAGTTGSVFIIPHGAAATAAVTPVQISSTVGSGPARLMPDATSVSPATVPGNIWVTSNSNFVSQLSKSTAPGNLNGWVTTPFTTLGNSRGISVDSANNVFVSAANSISQLAHSGTTWAPANGFPFAANTAGISGPSQISVDGRSNVWIPNIGQLSVSEISTIATPLSPLTGFQKDSTFFDGSIALAVDQAGNVWIAGVANSAVTEIVGAAVPVFQPYSVGISGGHFQAIP